VSRGQGGRAAFGDGAQKALHLGVGRCRKRGNAGTGVLLLPSPMLAPRC
jgi:hypothetical protein